MKFTAGKIVGVVFVSLLAVFALALTIDKGVHDTWFTTNKIVGVVFVALLAAFGIGMLIDSLIRAKELFTNSLPPVPGQPGVTSPEEWTKRYAADA